MSTIKNCESCLKRIALSTCLNNIHSLCEECFNPFHACHLCPKRCDDCFVNQATLWCQEMKHQFCKLCYNPTQWCEFCKINPICKLCGDVIYGSPGETIENFLIHFKKHCRLIDKMEVIIPEKNEKTFDLIGDQNKTIIYFFQKKYIIVLKSSITNKLYYNIYIISTIDLKCTYFPRCFFIGKGNFVKEVSGKIILVQTIPNNYDICVLTSISVDNNNYFYDTLGYSIEYDNRKKKHSKTHYKKDYNTMENYPKSIFLFEDVSL